MSLKGVFSTVVGLATIVGTLMYAVDNKWVDDVPDLTIAIKTIDVSPAPAEIEKLSSPSVTSRPKAVKRKVRRRKRLQTHSKPRSRPSQKRRKSVSFFADAKDIPHPNTLR